MVIVTFTLFLGTISTYIFFQYEAGKTETNNQMTKVFTQSSKTESEAKEESFIQAKEPENNEPINVLLVGVDTTSGNIARTDTIMLAQFNPTNGDAKLASIMRDSYVKIPGRSNNKINASFAFGGVELLQDTLETNFGIDIHYYALANFDGFVTLVDTIAPNGLEVMVEKKMDDPMNHIHFEPGLQKLNGDATLKYVRFRKDAENDFGRVKRQQEVIKTLKEELFTISGISKIPKLIGTLEPQIETNIRTSKLLSLGRDVVLHPIQQIETMRIPTEDSFKNTYYPHAGAVLEIDIEKNRQALSDFFTINHDNKQEKKAD